MKILQVTPAYKPAFIYGGPTMSVSMLAEQLARAGENVTVFTTTANGKRELDIEADKPINVDGVSVTYFKRITKDHTHFSPRLLMSLWKQCRQFDVIHIHGWWNTVSVLTCLTAQKRKMPVVVSPRGMLSNYSFNNKNNSAKGFIHRFLGRKLLNKSFVHTTSDNEYQTVSSLVNPKEVFNIPNFVKLNPAKNFREPLNDGILKLIFFSRVEEKKGLDILIEALKLINIPFHLIIAGTGEQTYINQLKKIAADNNVSDKIDWIGFQSENKFDLLAGHDLMVLPSYDENFGNVVIESLSVGTAVLISEQVGLADYVKEKQVGWICKTDVSSISETINAVYHHKTELENIRINAPEKIRADFSSDSLTRKYINMYQSIIQLASK